MYNPAVVDAYLAANPQIDTVLFDIGGVLASDVVETMLLTPTYGLADRLKLDATRVARAAQNYMRQWDATPGGTVVGFWRAVETGGRTWVQIPVKAEQQGLVEANPRARTLFAMVQKRGLRMGLISDNTEFFVPWQQNAFPAMLTKTDPKLRFYSYASGCRKSDATDNLFDYAAKHVDPARTLIVDDRPGNVAAAQKAGFHAVEFRMRQEWRLSGRDLPPPLPIGAGQDDLDID